MTTLLTQVERLKLITQQDAIPLDKILDQSMEFVLRLHLASLCADELANIHSKGLVAQFLTPQTVKVTNSHGNLAVKFDEPQQQLQNISTWTGDELVYLAPETFSRSQINSKADVYSLSMLVAHLVTGERPFGNQMPVVSATLALHESLRPSLPDSTDPTNPLPQSVQLILQQAWDADPSVRPSATELAMVLRGAVVDVDVDAVLLSSQQIHSLRQRSARKDASDADSADDEEEAASSDWTDSEDEQPRSRALSLNDDYALGASEPPDSEELQPEDAVIAVVKLTDSPVTTSPRVTSAKQFQQWQRPVMARKVSASRRSPKSFTQAAPAAVPPLSPGSAPAPTEMCKYGNHCSVYQRVLHDSAGPTDFLHVQRYSHPPATPKAPPAPMISASAPPVRSVAHVAQSPAAEVDVPQQQQVKLKKKESAKSQESQELKEKKGTTPTRARERDQAPPRNAPAMGAHSYTTVGKHSEVSARPIQSGGAGTRPGESAPSATDDQLYTNFNEDVMPLAPHGAPKLLPETFSQGSPLGRTISLDSMRQKPYLLDMNDLIVREQIGEGNFSTVMMATYKGQPVAFKMLKKRDNIEDLEHEADILYPLRHQNVVEFLGICLNPPALVTELLLVGDLRSFLRKISDGIDYRQRLSMALDVARGMEYLHNQHPYAVLHRDLKASNLLVTDDKRVKVSDFGLSRHNDKSMPKITALDLTTVAPEVLRDPRAFAEPADVYAFALVLWEIQARCDPFSGVDVQTAARNVLIYDERPFIPEDTEAPLRHLITRCWQRDPYQRPTFSEICRELSELLHTVCD